MTDYKIPKVTWIELYPNQPTWQVRAYPHRCPVCSGTGSVPTGFYGYGGTSTSANPEKCRSCNGTGVLWG